MKRKAENRKKKRELRHEYDLATLKTGVRGKYTARYQKVGQHCITDFNSRREGFGPAPPLKHYERAISPSKRNVRIVLLANAVLSSYRFSY